LNTQAVGIFGIYTTVHHFPSSRWLHL